MSPCLYSNVSYWMKGASPKVDIKCGESSQKGPDP